MKISSKELVNKMEATLNNIGYDLSKAIFELGQVSRSEQRDRGETFSINEHLKGLILSMLSNQRPWGPIVQNMDKITDIFFGFQLDKIKQSDKTVLAKQLKNIKCGNRSIDKQMENLDYNIRIFEQIEVVYGSLDQFVVSDTPDNIAWELGQGRKYKLKQMGYTLALEYLRNVGVKAIKPDLHIRRIIGDERLNFCSGYPSEIETVKIMGVIAEESGVNLTYLDNLMWLYCALDYANICGSDPKCNLCELQHYCNMGLSKQAV
ncbi:thermostable 8-oxoguanine DNA glycosylase [Paenibacillus sp. V4I9]|uniref:hypothetical protein n=1 Tax=Paenibacillus sp. V4I9 TaxID=3042308 RepID=UPI002783152D|nr:hypothetical protein [Paenibacillus sp. V4I9]MDQ0890682.1 thermostable 8-oxoguanine DNA glycosylase [Paenibacillus sp. V4I9]